MVQQVMWLIKYEGSQVHILKTSIVDICILLPNRALTYGDTPRNCSVQPRV